MILSGLPVEVIYPYPPLIKKKTAEAVPMRVIICKVSLVKFVISELVDTCAITGEAKKREKIKPLNMPASNFIIVY